MLRRGPSLLLMLALAILSAGCGSASEPPTASNAPSSTPAPPATATAQPGLDMALLLLRGDSDPQYPAAGAIWISDLAGVNARQVTPEGVPAAFIGLVKSKTGETLVYYATQDAEGNTTVYSANLATSETASVLAYRDVPGFYYADISPDGQYIVHTQPAGLDMYDLTTGTSTTLFESGNGPDCLAGRLEQCYRAISPNWSPDGRLVTVVHTIYEGGWAEVVDPFQTPIAVLTTGDRSYPRMAKWSPGSDAICAYGVGLGEASGLYLLESPDWEARNLFPEFEDYTVNPDSRTLVACDWVSPNEVAFLTMVERPQRGGELHLFDRVTGQSRLIVQLPDGTGCCGGIIAAVPGTSYVVTQLLRDEGGPSFLWSQPAVVNLETGETKHILQKEDIILSAFAR